MSTHVHPKLNGRSLCGAAAQAAARRRRAAGDEGMTLVELLIASTLLIVLLTAVMVTMDMLNTVNNSVNAQYQEFDQALPALSPLQTLLRAEVEPLPPSGSTPSPGFATIGNFSLLFYADIGTAYNNVTSLGTTGGPAKIVAQELDANGNPVSSSTTCSTKSLCSFQVWEYLPQIANGISNCPSALQGGSACSYTGYKVLVNVIGITNNPNPSNGTIQPIFTYNVLDPASGTGFNLTTTGTANGYTCTAPTGTTTVTTPCNDYIQSVGVELMVSRKGAGTNGTVDEQTVVYRYAKSPGACAYPYQFNTPTVYVPTGC